MTQQLDLYDWNAVYPVSPGFKVSGPSQEAAVKGTGSLSLAPISHGNGGFAQ